MTRERYSSTVDVAQVDAVDLDRAGLRVVEPAQQLGQRRLAGAVHTDDRHRGAGRDRQVEAVEHGPAARGVAEGHVAEPELAARRVVGDRARHPAASAPAARHRRRAAAGRRRPGAAAPSSAQLRPPNATALAPTAACRYVVAAPSPTRPSRTASASAQNTNALPASTIDQRTDQRPLAQPGRLPLQLVEPGTPRGEPLDHPAGQAEQPQLLRRRRLDGEVVGVVGVPLRVAHLGGVAVAPHTALAQQPVGRAPRPRAARAAPTRRTPTSTSADAIPDSSWTSPPAMKSIATTQRRTGASRGRSRGPSTRSSASSGFSRWPMPGGVTRRDHQAVVQPVGGQSHPRISLTACCSGVSTCRATNTIPDEGQRAGQRRAGAHRADEHARSRRRAAAGIAPRSTSSSPPGPAASRGDGPEQDPEERPLGAGVERGHADPSTAAVRTDGHERPDVGEAHPAVGRPSRLVEVVDVEADDRGDLASGDLGHRRHARCRRARGRAGPAAPTRPAPGRRRLTEPISALNTHPAALDPGEGAAGAHQLGDPAAVGRAAVGAERGHPDLLGEHRDAGRQQHVQLVRPDPADERVGGDDGGVRAMRHQRLRVTDLAGRAPGRLQHAPQSRLPRRARRRWRRTGGPAVGRGRRRRDGLAVRPATGTRFAPAWQSASSRPSTA